MNTRKKFLEYLISLIAKFTEMPEEEIDTKRDMEDYGINSIMIMELTSEIETKLSCEVSKTLFFEYKTINEIADYFIDNYEFLLITIFSQEMKEEKVKAETAGRIFNEISGNLFNQNISFTNIIDYPNEDNSALEDSGSLEDNSSLEDSGFIDDNSFIEDDYSIDEKHSNEGDIAIIGISGVFPEANNISELWTNLSKGKDSIIEINHELWDDNKDLLYCKWGGFINDVDKFDPLFFKISPKEAEKLDPQVRLFLQESWRSVEDAGYSMEHFSNKKVGVFVGVMWGQYQNFGIEETAKGNMISLESSFATIANRVSYTFNLKGPSLAVDSMCSSSLSALHLACNSLKQGECEAAIVGGVNLNLHVNKYISICNGKFGSTTGQCKSFGKGGDGYIPGEGIVSILVKPLDKAVADNDNIYGVIKSTTVNHGGKTNGYTVPNPNAQKSLVIEALKKANIEPSSISYIEAHGTGTSLGDPIEIEALRKAIKYNKEEKCAIGSIKSNIGHLEAASGLAGLIKVLLQMKHKKIVPSLHSEERNPLIKFEETPFYVPQILEDWDITHSVRRAGISSFGAGGANAHIIVEEYCNDKKTIDELKTKIFLLSSSSKEQLILYAKGMQDFLQDYNNLNDMTYTLIYGRKHFSHRLFFCYESKEELLNHLNCYINNQDTEHVIYGESMIKNEKLNNAKDLSFMEVGKKWCDGYEIPWSDIIATNVYKRASLPTYPFLKEKIWYQEGNSENKSSFSYENKSDVFEQKYVIKLAKSCLMTDHVVKEQCILPGTMFISLTDYFYKEAFKEQTCFIKSLNWKKSYHITDNTAVIILKINMKDNIIFEYYGNDDKNLIVEIQVNKDAVKSNENTLSFSRDSLNETIEANEFYNRFINHGIQYKGAFKSLEKIRYSDAAASAKLRMDLSNNNIKLIRNSIILDAALQTVMPLQKENQLYLPVGTGQILFYGDLAKVDSIYAIKDKINHNGDIFNITLYNSMTNEILVEIHDLIFKSVQDNKTLKYYHMVWEESELIKQQVELNEIVFVGFEDQIPNELKLYNNYYTVSANELQTFLLNNTQVNKIIYNVKNLFDKNMYQDDSKPLLHLMEIMNKILSVRKDFRILLVSAIADESTNIYFRALEGFFNSLIQESPNFKYKLLSNFDLGNKQSIPLLLDEVNSFDYKQVNYELGKRVVNRIQVRESINELENNYNFKSTGVYVVVGGGGIAEEIIYGIHYECPKANIAIIRRNVNNINLVDANSHIVTYPCDINDSSKLEEIFTKLRNKFYRINGIIFSAGIVKDSLFANKDLESVKKVVETKVKGVNNIDFILKEDALDFFILFSSMSSILGNVGQTDYSFSNAYLNYFAQNRNTQVNKGERIGFTKSLVWPLLNFGGIQLSDKQIQKIENHTGLSTINKELGKKIFFETLSRKENMLIIAYGNFIAYDNVILSSSYYQTENKDKNRMIQKEKNMKQICNCIRTTLSNELNLSVERIKVNESLQNYGLDSVVSLDLVDNLEKQLNITLPKTLFYDFQTIMEIAEYIILNHLPQLILESEDAVNDNNREEIINEKKEVKTEEKNEEEKFNQYRFAGCSVDNRLDKDIAIIGIAGYYPEAETLDELWEILKNGKSVITEIPNERWDNELLFSKDKSSKGKYYNKWGSFLKNYKMFDPEFFNISPDEAEEMDPQERLFLQTAWNCVEDAGYKISDLSNKQVGVYVGAMWSLYQLYGYEIYKQGKYKYNMSSLASIANRVSYQFNLRGPSIALDTMCSSSLTAIHLASQSIQSGESDYCLVGGVNLSLHFYKYLSLCNKELLSTDGKCKSFGKDGDGYVPGEGVGAVLMKPLKKAIADKDNIYGIIKGISINHGGQSGGFTVPSTKAQANVIGSALEKSGLKSSDINYIEAHGTGTALGDPIEMNGLSNAYEVFDKPCPVGSIKSNIGHLESAAGIAALTKVILQLKYKYLVPSLYSKELNPFLDLNRSKLFVQQELVEWTPVNNIRCAGISSFGAGGSNAHLILQEYIEKMEVKSFTNKQVIILFSANDKESLDNVCNKFLVFLSNENTNEDYLERIAFTLQTGREIFKYKIAFIVSSIKELVNLMKDYLQHGTLEYSSYKSVYPDFKELLEGNEGKIFINSLAKSNKLEQLVKLWLNGAEIDWILLYQDKQPKKISLPTYAFKNRECWVNGFTNNIVMEDTSSQDSLELEIKQKGWIYNKIIKMLGIDQDQVMDIDTQLIDIGFSSIYALRLLNEINYFTKKQIKLMDIEYSPSRNLFEFSENIEQVVEKSKENRECPAQLEVESEKIYFPEKENLVSKVNVNTILLTGCTGNVGSGILLYLLKDTTHKVICLMRDGNQSNAKNRLEKVMRSYKEMNNGTVTLKDRVSIVLGDISKPHIGLNDKKYNSLTSEVDLVIHGAASTSLTGDFEEVKDINIGGTKNMIDFTLDTKSKLCVYISTHMVLGNKWYETEETLFDETMLEAGQHFKHLGYQKSKFMAEKLVRENTDKGLRWIVMRIGNIMGRSDSGEFPLERGNCLYYDILKTTVENKIAMNTSLYFDITPLDFVCKSIIALMERMVVYETFHITNPNPVRMTQLYHIIQECGYEVQILEDKLYLDNIYNKGGKASIYEELVKYNPVFSKSTSKSSYLNNEYTIKILKELKISCPSINKKLVNTYLEYCINKGYINLTLQ